MNYTVEMSHSTFGFKIMRASDNDVLFDSSSMPFVVRWFYFADFVSIRNNTYQLVPNYPRIPPFTVWVSECVNWNWHTIKTIPFSPRMTQTPIPKICTVLILFIWTIARRVMHMVCFCSIPMPWMWNWLIKASCSRYVCEYLVICN